jgi:hypothetical protein
MIDFFSGCFGGIIGVIISHPIDTIKSRIQKDINFKDAIKMKKFYSGLGSPLCGVP